MTREEVVHRRNSLDDRSPLGAVGHGSLGIAGGFLGLSALVLGGCSGSSPMPGGVTSASATASPTSETTPAGASSGSLFLPKSIRVQAMWPNAKGTPEPIGLKIHGSPQSVVHQAMEQAKTRHAEVARGIEKRIESLRADLASERDRLSDTNAAVSVEYNEKVPEQSEAMARTARNSLKHLSKARAQKTAADDWLREAHAVRIVPIEQSIQSLEAASREAQHGLNSHLSSLPQVLFAALPNPPQKTWTTDVRGEEVISIPPGEPWVFWAEHLGTRWVLTSNNLDANGKLSFDEKSGRAARPSSILSQY